MKREINLAWCRENLKWRDGSFADMERVRLEREKELREQYVKYAGCPKIQKQERAA